MEKKKGLTHDPLFKLITLVIITSHFIFDSYVRHFSLMHKGHCD